MIYHLPEITSTMSLLAEPQWQDKTDKYVFLTTDYQTEGHGQKGNSWESEQNANLLIGISVHPHFLPIRSQFLLSEITALATAYTLSEYTSGIQLKWPNDIYFENSKLGGILIEHHLNKNILSRSIIGVGINVNQEHFLSNAPNPISLRQIIGQKLDRAALLTRFIHHFKTQYELLEAGKITIIHTAYRSFLYRQKGWHSYADAKGTFLARFIDVQLNGTLILLDTSGQERHYQFKEVQFIL